MSGLEGFEKLRVTDEVATPGLWGAKLRFRVRASPGAKDTSAVGVSRLMSEPEF